MIETTFDRLRYYIWPGPGESSEEAGRTPTVYIRSAATHQWLDSDAIRTGVLEYIGTLTRLIYPSHIIVADGHFMLTWIEADSQPITVQLLIEEQYEAMLHNRIAAAANMTWTGEKWIQDSSYIRQWAPNSTLRGTHAKDYRTLLDYATLHLCTMLCTPFIPPPAREQLASQRSDIRGYTGGPGSVPHAEEKPAMPIEQRAQAESCSAPVLRSHMASLAPHGGLSPYK